MIATRIIVALPPTKGYLLKCEDNSIGWLGSGNCTNCLEKYTAKSRRLSWQQQSVFQTESHSQPASCSPPKLHPPFVDLLLPPPRPGLIANTTMPFNWNPSLIAAAIRRLVHQLSFQPYHEHLCLEEPAWKRIPNVLQQGLSIPFVSYLAVSLL